MPYLMTIGGNGTSSPIYALTQKLGGYIANAKDYTFEWSAEVILSTEEMIRWADWWQHEYKPMAYGVTVDEPKVIPLESDTFSKKRFGKEMPSPPILSKEKFDELAKEIREQLKEGRKFDVDIQE